MRLTGAVSRKNRGKSLGDVLGLEGSGVTVSGTVDASALEGCHVMVEYTGADSARNHIATALDAGVHVVVGTSGLTDADYGVIHEKALEKGLGVLAVGNFALTVVLLQKFAEIAARHIPQWEIIDYATDLKPDAPSGTARELAMRLSDVRRPELTVPLDRTLGTVSARGASLSGVQVHSVRLPGHTLSVEAIFGMQDQRLSLRHDAGSGAQPYVDGALLAIRKVSSFTGLRRGLDTVLDLS
jgi:4-hydroxy-tetrahydrodipicolinate reductase